MPELEILISLIIFAFCAGMIDAAIGGGGLIQIPALMGNLPQLVPATVFGTNKLASIFGTATAAWSYFKRVSLPLHWLLIVASAAFLSAYFGAMSVSLIPAEQFRPIILVLLIVIAVYTLFKKDFGQQHRQLQLHAKHYVVLVIACLAIGFYDGIFGPGTGSFFIFFFIRYLHLDFLHASALSKIGNFTTNLAALTFFMPAGHVLFQIGMLMAIANICGAVFGVRLAVRYGSQLLRWLFLILLLFLIGRLMWQML